MKTKSLLIAAALALCGCNGDIHVIPGQAYFKSFTYTGNDPELDDSALQPGEIKNPILQGSYSDPAVCRKGSDYYMATATYSCFPGLAVLHSTDLVNWEQISYAMPTEEQCLNTSLRSEQGVFPASLKYNEHNDTFYIVGTVVGGGGYFIIKAKDPAGPWSNPEWLYGLGGVHPCIFFDDDGKAYLLNQGGPDYVPPYSDFKVIWLQELDVNTMKNVGDRKIILAGGDILEKKPTWLESPHMFKKDGYYYLSATEGGSLGNGAAVCMYRAKNIFGPYEHYSQNPILTQRRLSPGRENAVANTCHADFVDTPDGEMWSFFLGARSYSSGGDHNQGRETFIAPVQFDEGWPYIIRNGEEVPRIVKAPNGAKIAKEEKAYSKFIPHGNFTYTENFESDTLPLQWFHLRTPVGAPFVPNSNEGLIMPLEINTIRSVRHTGFIAMRQMHNMFSAETELHFVPQTPNEFAGMALFLTDNNNYEFGITQRSQVPCLVLQKAVKANGADDINKEEIAKIKLEEGFFGRIYLKAERTADGFAFQYKFSPEGQYTDLVRNVPAEYLSLQRANSFYGTIIGIYASQEEEEI